MTPGLSLAAKMSVRICRNSAIRAVRLSASFLADSAASFLSAAANSSADDLECESGSWFQYRTRRHHEACPIRAR